MQSSHEEALVLGDETQQTGARGPIKGRELARVVRELATSFFFGRGEESGVRDRLVEVVRRDSVAASWFIQSMMIFTIFGSMLVCGCCVGFLAVFWSRCACCDRPLRWWLVGQALLHLIQVPVRVVLLVVVRSAERRGNGIEESVASLTSSPAWRTSKVVPLLLYGWFVLGVVWLMRAEGCPSCPGINMLVSAIMFLSGLRVAITIITFRVLFGNSQPPIDPEAGAPQAADAVAINALPLVPCTKEGFSGACFGEACAVCLTDFDAGQIMRRLPCGHHFHRICIDTWLGRNKRCPLCMHAVDESCGLRFGTGG